MAGATQVDAGPGEGVLLHPGGITCAGGELGAGAGWRHLGPLAAGGHRAGCRIWLAALVHASLSCVCPWPRSQQSLGLMEVLLLWAAASVFLDESMTLVAFRD